MTGLKKRGGRRGPIVEINMIPLIDVSLVLLIIFMVMTPFLIQQQIKINLPHAVSSTEAPDKPIIISIQPQGDVSLDGHPIAVATLEAELQSKLGPNNDRAVVIQADKDIPLQKVVSIMDIAKRLKVGKLGITTEQPK